MLWWIFWQSAPVCVYRVAVYIRDIAMHQVIRAFRDPRSTSAAGVGCNIGSTVYVMIDWVEQRARYRHLQRTCKDF